MMWDEYKNNFLEKAKLAGKNKAYCDNWLDYAKKLHDQNIPIIYSPEHFSKLVGYSLFYIYSASNAQEFFYRRYKIPKKNGGKRIISEPLPGLKNIQRWILKEILNNLSFSAYAKAYISGKSVKDNARFHQNCKVVMTLDINDYFGNIHFNKVLELFLSLGYKENVSVLLANLCTFRKALPQGAPTSPAISNLCSLELDNMISVFTKERGVRYTRYADDMTFSGDFNAKWLYKKIKEIVIKNGFCLNYKKTRFLYCWQRQLVTGLVVNKKMNVRKDIRKKLRQEVYYIKKHGIDNHMAYIGEKKSNYLEHLIGIAGYATFISPKNEEMRNIYTFLRSLLVKM